MSTNAELAAIFGEMAAILELTGANGFRVNAHARVARVLKDLTVEVTTLADDEKALIAIEGIGSGSARKIIEHVKTGRIADHQALLEEIPHGLLEVVRIPGLGPKTVRLMWQQAGVTDMASLQAAIDSGALVDLPRMGDKSVANIKRAMAFASRGSERVRLGTATTRAHRIVKQLAAVHGTRRVEYAGSLRRGRETIGDIDILASTTDPGALSDVFRSMDDVADVLAAGETKSSVRLEDGLQVDLRVVDEDVFGAALLYFTGSKEHNVVLRERAVRKKLRLNEYGLFPDDGDETPPQNRGVAPVAAETEESIYAALGLSWIPPELRENRGEFDVEIPALIETVDIRCELHAHTIASDGKLTIEQLALAAQTRGFHTIAVTDHSQSSALANGLSPDRLRRHIDAIRLVDEQFEGIRILAGSEVDILADGRLDYEDDLLAELDIVVASPHTALRQEPEMATRRLVAAVSHPLVHILGHPTGRMINKRAGLSPDINAVIQAAVEHGTALEINSNEMRLDLRDVHVRAALDAGALIAVNTDTHREQGFDQLRYGILTGRRGGLTADRCVNCLDRSRLLEWLGRKR